MRVSAPSDSSPFRLVSVGLVAAVLPRQPLLPVGEVGEVGPRDYVGVFDLWVLHAPRATARTLLPRRVSSSRPVPTVLAGRE